MINICDVKSLEQLFGDYHCSNDDNMISAYINDLKDGIGNLQMIADGYDAEDEEREMLNMSSRTMALILYDLKRIRSEIRAAAIIDQAAQKGKKGGKDEDDED